ncbi:iron transporter [Brackiella oedipodis]|uniref:iron transporter n=1 Tax=Brackiella oedipodis TaxID=124225 RepID=UPI0004901102|nr:iron transporter [Brackiella oedipodis]
MKTFKKTLLALSLLGLGATAMAAETPIGEPVKNEDAGLEIAAVYLQPIEMEIGDQWVKKGHKMLSAKEADVHVEADIHALAKNKNGFAEDEWVPYLTVNYELKKKDSDWSKKGTFMAMVADDGPHYGENVKLDGPGKYNLKYEILPPSANQDIVFGRHTDKETGVDEWFKPVEVSWDFNYAGTGKKGGY